MSYSPRVTYMEYVDAHSAKWYQVELHDDASMVTSYGALGRLQSESTQRFDTQAEAEKAADKIIRSKTKKGYVIS